MDVVGQTDSVNFLALIVDMTKLAASEQRILVQPVPKVFSVGNIESQVDSEQQKQSVHNALEGPKGGVQSVVLEHGRVANLSDLEKLVCEKRHGSAHGDSCKNARSETNQKRTHGGVVVEV